MGEQQTKGSARGDTMQGGGGRKASQVCGSLALPGAKDLHTHHSWYHIHNPAWLGAPSCQTPSQLKMGLIGERRVRASLQSPAGCVLLRVLCRTPIPTPCLHAFLLTHRSQFLQSRKLITYRLTQQSIMNICSNSSLFTKLIRNKINDFPWNEYHYVSVILTEGLSGCCSCHISHLSLNKSGIGYSCNTHVGRCTNLCVICSFLCPT